MSALTCSQVAELLVRAVGMLQPAPSQTENVGWLPCASGVITTPDWRKRSCESQRHSAWSTTLPIEEEPTVVKPLTELPGLFSITRPKVVTGAFMPLHIVVKLVVWARAEAATASRASARSGVRMGAGRCKRRTEPPRARFLDGKRSWRVIPSRRAGRCGTKWQECIGRFFMGQTFGS